MELENVIEIVMKMSPMIMIFWGLLLFTIKKYQENHDSVLVGKIVKVL